MTLDLEALSAKLAAATHGEWSLDRHRDGASIRILVLHGPSVLDWDATDQLGLADADLIVSLVNAAPELIAELRRTRVERDEARSVVERLYPQETVDALTSRAETAERERDEARASSEAWRQRSRGLAKWLLVYLRAQPQDEKVTETIRALVAEVEGG